MGKLHEIIAVESDLKSEATRILAEVGSLFSQGTVRLVGQVRKYSPLEEQGEKLSDEITELATTVKDELKTLWESFGRWTDVTIQKEVTNGTTSANVEVDGKVILSGLPATALLNLEAKLASLRSVYGAIPTNDPTERWNFDKQSGIYVSEPRDTYRTKKIPKALVGYDATKEHPAQVQYYQEDVREGVWTTTKRSGMLSPSEKRIILERVDALLRAVKAARQRANEAEVKSLKVSDKIYDFIHG